jgi:hypothetical protein
VTLKQNLAFPRTSLQRKGKIRLNSYPVLLDQRHRPIPATMTVLKHLHSLRSQSCGTGRSMYKSTAVLNSMCMPHWLFQTKSNQTKSNHTQTDANKRARR